MWANSPQGCDFGFGFQQDSVAPASTPILQPGIRRKLNEHVEMQFRGEVFNIFNHSNFDNFTMNTDLSSPTIVGLVRFTPDVGNSNPVIGSGGSRHIQLGFKVVW